MRIFTGLIVLLCALQVHGIEVTQDQAMQGLTSQHPNMVATGSEYSPTEINAYLANLEELEGVFLTDKWLKRLATRSQPSTELVAWVRSKQYSSKILSMADPDHPERQLVIVDIARQAKTTLAVWETDNRAQLIHEQWQNGRLDWSESISGKGGSNADAWESWINNLGKNELSLVKEHYIEFGLPLMDSSNRVLAALIKKSGSERLIQTLLERPADQYSYQILQSLPQTLMPTKAISLMQLALNNSALQSQALMGLTKHYSDQLVVQRLLMDRINKASSQWLAATIVTEFGHPELKQQLAVHFDGKKEPLASYVRARLQEAEK